MPLITLTGPRQSGKTTLVKHCFSDFTYLNLEETDKKEIALTYPRLFIDLYKGTHIIDEAQNVPDNKQQSLHLKFINQIRNKKSAIRNLLNQSLLIKLVDKIGDIVFATPVKDVPAMGIYGMYTYK